MKASLQVHLARFAFTAVAVSVCPAQVVLDSSTGHAYEVVDQPLTWHEAAARARQASWNDRPGRLAEIQTPAEWRFLIERVLRSPGAAAHWLGGYRRAAATAPQAGWSWVHPSPFWTTASAPWLAGEPDGGVDERYLAVAGREPGFVDARSSQAVDGYVIEYQPPSATSLSRSGPLVDLTAGDLRVRFDTRFGGGALGMFRRRDGAFGENLISPHPGEGLNPVHETTQDATQTSPNGVTTYPIATFVVAADPYWGRETVYAPATGAQAESVYEVVTFPPLFWLSHEARDDAIAGLDLPAKGDWPLRTGWLCYYTSPCADIAACSGRNFTGPGVPIWFDPRPGGPTDGIVYVGNEMLWDTANPEPWSRRLCTIPDGRQAVRLRISLRHASADAIAGIHFRRQVPAGASIDAAFSAPGYALNVNPSGLVELQRWSGGVSETPWTSPGAAPTITSETGTLLEIRTHNLIPGQLEIWIDGKRKHTWVDPVPILGAHCGLYARTQAGTSIRFADRTVVDVGLELAARWTARTDGVLDSDFAVRPAPGAESTVHGHYPVSGLHVFFDRRTTPKFDTFAVFDRNGDLAAGEQITPPSGGNPATGAGFRHVRVLPAAEQVRESPSFSVWCGASARTDLALADGIHLTPLLIAIDGHPARDARVLLQSKASGPLLFAGLSPFRFEHVPPVAPRPTPIIAGGYRTVLRWSAGIPTELAYRSHGFGAGCPAANGTVPYHRTGSGPMIGTTMELDLLDAPAVAPAALLYGRSEAQLDLAFAGSAGCTLFMQPSIVVPCTTNAIGRARILLPTWYELSSVGDTFLTQFAVIDPGANRVIVSHASRSTVGS